MKAFISGRCSRLVNVTDQTKEGGPVKPHHCPTWEDGCKCEAALPSAHAPDYRSHTGLDIERLRERLAARLYANNEAETGALTWSELERAGAGGAWYRDHYYGIADDTIYFFLRTVLPEVRRDAELIHREAVREAKGYAWDEGYIAGFEDVTSPGSGEHPAPNPYRYAEEAS
jgi:hypothetical protein